MSCFDQTSTCELPKSLRIRLNIKMSSYQYKDSHVKDKTVSPTVLSLTWESPYLGKTVFILRRGPESFMRSTMKHESCTSYIQHVTILKDLIRCIQCAF